MPLLGWLQVAFLVFATYGLAQWAIVKYADRLGPGRARRISSAAFIGLGASSPTAFWTCRHARGTPARRLVVDRSWHQSVAAVAAMWMDAFRYKLNWWLWSLSNLAFLPLAVHSRLWGPFTMTFVYQAINVAGWFQWVRDEKRLSSMPVDVEGRIAAVTAPARTL